MNEKRSERDFLIEWIDVYKSLPELWDRKQRDYNNKWKKQQSYELLLEKYRERYPEADIGEVKKKINSLRTNFRKELKRVNRLRINCGDENYMPDQTLWYFDSMMFLADQELMNSSSCKIEIENEEMYDSSAMEYISLPEPMPQTKNELPVPTEQYMPDTKETYIPPPKVTYIEDPCKYSPEESSKYSNEESCKYSHDIDNEYSRIAQVWATELRKMDFSQQVHAKKAINDILYYGQLGKLNENTIIRTFP